jgi:hypothetical protein
MEVIGRSLTFVAVLFAADIILSIKYFVTAMIVKALLGAPRSADPNGIEPMSGTSSRHGGAGRLGGNPPSLEFTFGTNYLPKASRRPVGFQRAERPQEI